MKNKIDFTEFEKNVKFTLKLFDSFGYADIAVGKSNKGLIS